MRITYSTFCITSDNTDNSFSIKPLSVFCFV